MSKINLLAPAAALTVAMVAACAPSDRVPPQKPFVKDGAEYHWSLAHGVTGGLLLIGPERAGGGNVELVLSCSGLKSGGMQARFYAPAGGAAQLRLRADDMVFRVRQRVETFGEQSFVGGNGDLPDNYFDALAKAPTVTVEYAGQATVFAGPGEAHTRHFARYCGELAERASRDE
ncbi:hypothetical protein AS593_21915 [Caulobacter vibrioides]|nr:hypothetical protein AS593_21915 [Caulobacter vibrioides]